MKCYGKYSNNKGPRCNNCGRIMELKGRMWKCPKYKSIQFQKETVEEENMFARLNLFKY